MIVHVGFHYSMQVKLPRKIKATQVYVSDTIPVELHEPTDAALVVQLPSDMDIPPLSDKDDIYFWDDKWWHPARHNYSGEPRYRLRLEDHLGALRENGSSDSIVLFQQHGRVPYGTQIHGSVEEVGAREICSSMRDDVIAGIQSRSNCYIVIDGVVMQQCSEPVITASMESMHQRRGFFLYANYDFLANKQQHRRFDVQNTWRLDQFDKMIAHHKQAMEGRSARRFAKVGPDVEVSFDHGLEPVNVLRPEFLTWDRERAWFWASFDNDMSIYAGGNFSRSSVDEFTLYANLRDGAPLIDRKNEDAIERMIDLVLPLSRYLQACGDENYRDPFARTLEAYKAYEQERSTENLVGMRL